MLNSNGVKIAIQAADLDWSRIDGTRVYIINLLKYFGKLDESSDFLIYHKSKFNPELTPPDFSNYKIKDSKISRDFYFEQFFAGKIRTIENKIKGLHRYYMHLGNFFFKEDIMDLVGSTSDSSDPDHQRYYNKMHRNIVSSYISQFEVIERV